MGNHELNSGDNTEPTNKIEYEEALEAARVLAGRAAEFCTCPIGSGHTACGLADVLDALSLKEVLLGGPILPKESSV